jgi:hypothetical protein
MNDTDHRTGCGPSITLGTRLRRKLEQSADFDDLMLLSQLDKAGTRSGGGGRQCG